MFDRVLELDLGDFMNATQRFKWRFFEVLPDGDRIRIEVPKGDTENLVLIVENTAEIVLALKANDFIEQEIKTWRHF